MQLFFFWFFCYSSRQYRGNEGQMRELQDQLEAEQYFSVSWHLKVPFLLFKTNLVLSVMSVFPQTLYKTQVKELKEEIEERNRQVQEAHKKVQDLSSERWVWNLEKYEIIDERKRFKNVSSPRHRDSLSAQLDLTVTKAESEQLARALQEEQYFELSQENKKAGARYKQEVMEKDAIISRVSTQLRWCYVRRGHCIISLLSCRLNFC